MKKPRGRRLKQDPGIVTSRPKEGKWESQTPLNAAAEKKGPKNLVGGGGNILLLRSRVRIRAGA